MSDLTRGNLVFGSLNSKRSRVSLARRGEAGTAQGGRPQGGKRMTRRSSPRGNDEVAWPYCVGRGVSGVREKRGEENERQRQLDSAVGLGERRERGHRRAAEASGVDGERRAAGGVEGGE